MKMERPLKNSRPIGPFIDLEDDAENLEEEFSEPDVESIDDPILQQAEKWWQNISKEGKKREMMRNYMGSITDLQESEIEEKLDEAGL